MNVTEISRKRKLPDARCKATEFSLFGPRFVTKNEQTVQNVAD
jgi:hypothetical protein